MEEDEFEVKPSQIPGAGLGLYTLVDIEPDNAVLPYVGIIHHHEPYYGPDGREYHTYCYELSSKMCIDATDPTLSNKARYINDSRNSEFDNNVEFIEVPAPESRWGRDIWLHSTDFIPAGSELFVCYGDDYWT